MRMANIMVGVGAGQQSWMVHMKEFAAASAWLKNAFIGGTIVKLPHDNPRVFAWVYKWIYGKSFAGLNAGPVPVINDAGEPGDAEPDSDSDIEITAVKVKVENMGDPMHAEAAPAPAAAVVDAAPAHDNDELVVIKKDPITPRDLMELHLLAMKLEVYPLANSAMDALHDWFHPDFDERRSRGANLAIPGAQPIVHPAASAGNPIDIDDEGYQHVDRKKLSVRRVPYMTDVQHVYAHTMAGCAIRRFLISTVVIYILSKRPKDVGMGQDWAPVLDSTGEIGRDIIANILDYRVAKHFQVWTKTAWHTGEVVKMELEE